MPVFQKVLVANRGAIASRVLRTLHRMGIRSALVYSEADRDMPYLALADETHCIGAAPPRDSYLNQDTILQALATSGADALHPGYGFLSENAGFAARVIRSGVCFAGPSPKWIDAMGHKTRARELAAREGLPLARASGVLDGRAAALAAAEQVGYPVLVKPAAGGGGIGMLPARNPAELEKALERAASMAQRSFGNAEVYLERLAERPRHVEIQVLGDRHGALAHLFERDCSVQRRHQKLIEEATAPRLAREVIEPLARSVAAKLQRLGYDNIGTVEMLLSGDGEFSFLEMNTRLQVEHGVTEEVLGLDLVELQLRSAAGERLADMLPAQPRVRGHAIQARVYAEDPVKFLPSTGLLDVFRPPTGAGVRVETGFAEGGTVTPWYDPMLAKVIVHAPDRACAIATLAQALRRFEISGVKHNIPALLRILESAEFRAGDVHTGLAGEVLGRAP